MTKNTESIFAQYARQLIDRGFSVIPIAPGTKKPGVWSAVNGWSGMPNWTRFASRMPTEIELDIWEKWPDAAIGITLGKLSGLVGIDKDYDVKGDDALVKLLPYTPLKKKGEKGFCAFYRYSGERSCSFSVAGIRVLDILSDGRQTLLPPSPHPSGCTYVWIGESDFLSLTNADDLPTLPADFIEQCEKILAPLQTEDDKRLQRKTLAPKEDTDPIDINRSVQAQYFHDLNDQALAQIDSWVPRLIPGAVRAKDGYRAVATWRGAKNPNIGIHPTGIRDWGGGYGMTAIDLVMYANGLPFGRAAEELRSCVSISDAGAVSFGEDAAAQVAPRPASPIVMPWHKRPSAETLAPPKIELPATTSIEPAVAVPSCISNPPGMLKTIADWITETAPKSQPELSLAAAIALCATAMQRIYRSNLSNFTSIYMVMVAKSTEGKEHPQSCVERALAAAGLGNLIAGSGYTSSGAVFSALLKQPSHIAIIDEMGKLLKLSRSHGNANGEAAIDKLVEAFGRLNGVMRPPTYSSMSLSAKAIKELGNGQRIILKPAITILGATTPGTFYDSLTDDLVSDGFLGRLIVVESVQPRQLARFVDQTDPPERIVEWLKTVHNPEQRQGDLANVMSAELEPVTVQMTIEENCMETMRAFESSLIALKDQHEREKLDVLLGRTQEKALRLAMIAAKATDPDSSIIRREHVEWAQSYVLHYDLATVRAVRRNRAANQVDSDIKRLVGMIKEAKKLAKDPKVESRYRKALEMGATPHALLLKRMHMKSKEFQDLISTALEAGIIGGEKAPPDLGYAGFVYYDRSEAGES